MAIQNLLAEVPVMPATILALELLFQERTIDLRSVTSVVTNDLGATACMMSLSREDEPDARPKRLADSIAHFEMRELLDMLISHMA